MNSKLFTTFLVTALLCFTLVSAADFSVSVTNDLTKSNTDTVLTIKNNAATSLSVTIPSFNDITIGDQIISISQNASGTKTISAGDSLQVLISYDPSSLDLEDLQVGEYSTIGQITDGTDTLSTTITFFSSFCNYGDNSSDDYKLEISNVDIENQDGDDTEWSPLDEIEIEVEISNEGDEKVKDVMIEIGLYDSDGDNIIRDLEDLDDEEIDVGSIDDGDEETVIYSFKVPADLDEDGDYYLVIKAYSDEEGEENVCASQASDLDDTYYQVISIEKEDDEDKAVIIDNIKVSPNTASCGEIVQISAELFNIGDEEYEDQVMVTLVNEALGIEIEQIIRGDLDSGDSEQVEFEFEIPEDADEGNYIFEFRTYYEYREKYDDYKKISDETFTNFDNPLKVEGNCQSSPSSGNSQDARITASLDPETPYAVEGEQIMVQSTITNTGSVRTTYTISVFGNSAWSNLVEIAPQVFTLDAGESEDFSIVLELDEDAKGDQEFTIRATYDQGSVDQKVALNVEEADTVEVGSVLNHFKENWFIYVIILVNLILIIAIILVVRGMVRSSSISSTTI